MRRVMMWTLYRESQDQSINVHIGEYRSLDTLYKAITEQVTLSPQQFVISSAWRDDPRENER
jgi:hypothetical protein